ncbi:formate dehydrogenase subunit alpha [Thermus filiformis]|uniref:Formate dehydrogenase n=1 Tax=Thermus filiformis TaxID=276 RepID=A0A0A2WQQ2_THEFI|nr:formate dehydrogenase subunit alpha [Thermus filiformis]KGQ21082.1 formate dehydrogenase [Thermus filiformis]
MVTTCPYCGVGCQIAPEAREGRILRVLAPEHLPPNHGALCVKGRFGLDYALSQKRLLFPMLRERKGAPLRRASWEEALDYAAFRLAEILRRHGGEAVAVFPSAKTTNEEVYLAQKLARTLLKTNNVDHCSRLCHSSSTAALSRSLGGASMTNPLEDIWRTDLFVVVGSNTTETHPVIGAMIKKRVRQGARLVVIDPRYTGMAEAAHLWLRLRPGTDVFLLNAMARLILEEGLWDRAYVEERTEGFGEWAESLKPYTLERAEEVTGVEAGLIREAARLYATTPRAGLYWAMGVTQHTKGTATAQALVNLALLTGHVGREGAGLNPLRGQNNVQGAGDMGALPNVFPGYVPVEPETARRFGAAWGTWVPDKPGLYMTEVFERIPEVRAVYLIGEDPMTSEPFQDHTKKALEGLEFLIVQDILENETTPFADVVFPAASSLEKEGTFTNTDRRVQQVRRILDPPGEARPDLWITGELGRRLARLLGEPWKELATPEAVWNEVRSLLPGMMGGITYARLEAEGVRWPCPREDHLGEGVLFRERFNTPSGRARFFPAEYHPPAEPPDDRYPFTLSTGRVLFHWHGGTMSRNSRLEAAYPELKVEVNPKDAGRLGIQDGERIALVSRRGRIVARAWVTDRTPEGVVYAPFHFAEAPANRLTLNAYDPISRIPEYKVAAVRLEKLD